MTTFPADDGFEEYLAKLRRIRMRKPLKKKDIHEYLMLKSGHCHYCGITEKDFKRLFGTFRGGRRGKRLELDRKNPKGKYTVKNCVLACYACNDAKSDIFTQEEFKVIGKAIRKVWKKRENK